MDDSIKFDNGELKFKSIDFNDPGWEYFNDGIAGAASPDVIKFPTTLGSKFWEDNNKDMVNSPKHYTSGKVEAIEVIEDAISQARSPMAGFLQAQVLKYILRMWLKNDAKEDCEKARWYLNKLIDSL